jgi:hypothetical protein
MGEWPFTRARFWVFEKGKQRVTCGNLRLGFEQVTTSSGGFDK